MGDANEKELEPGVFRIEFVVPPEFEEGVYSNLVNVSFSPFEFILTFYQAIPPVAKEDIEKHNMKAKAIARIIVTPEIVEKLKDTLQTNLRNYKEKKKGKQQSEKEGDEEDASN